MQKEILKMSSDKKLTEKNIHVIREDPAWQLPEPEMVTTAKSYRDKKAIPLIGESKGNVGVGADPECTAYRNG